MTLVTHSKDILVKKHDDKAYPRGECSPFIQQRVVKTDVRVRTVSTFNVLNMEL